MPESIPPQPSIPAAAPQPSEPPSGEAHDVQAGARSAVNQALRPRKSFRDYLNPLDEAGKQALKQDLAACIKGIKFGTPGCTFSGVTCEPPRGNELAMFRLWVKDGDGDSEALAISLTPREGNIVDCYFAQWEGEGSGEPFEPEGGVFTNIFTILHLIAIKRFLESKGAGEGIKLRPLSRRFNPKDIQ